jgi:hypothetical protein
MVNTPSFHRAYPASDLFLSLCAVSVIYACLFIGLLIVRFRRTQESFGYLK